MNTKIILIVVLLSGIIGAGFLLNRNTSAPKAETKSPDKTPEQFIVLLDLSDRITQPGQIEADKELIQKTFEEFEKKAHAHLLINSKDKFQVCIAPQKNLPFDKDVEAEKLTFDLSTIKTAERVKKLKEFKATLGEKLNNLYSKAYVGNDTKHYEGSNIWQFFNETLPALTSKNIVTRLLVLTDGYFDFEENNAKLTDGRLSTTTEFMTRIRKAQNWKSEMENNGYGILPVNQNFDNTFVCVSEIRSKFAANLNEAEMLQYVWNDWLRKNGISDACSRTILHGGITTTENQLSVFLIKAI
jgi:hypothetical protein